MARSKQIWNQEENHKLVCLFLRLGVGGGETEIKLAQMLSLGNLQFSWEFLFQKLGEQNTTSSLGGEWIRESFLEELLFEQGNEGKVWWSRAWALESSKHGVKSQLYNLLAVWSWANDLFSLGLSLWKEASPPACLGCCKNYLKVETMCKVLSWSNDSTWRCHCYVV